MLCILSEEIPKVAVTPTFVPFHVILWLVFFACNQKQCHSRATTGVSYLISLQLMIMNFHSNQGLNSKAIL